MDYRSFILAFKNSPLYQNILTENDVIGVYVIGSQMLGLQDNESNYNIAVLIKGQEKEKESYTLESVDIEVSYITWDNFTHFLIEN